MSANTYKVAMISGAPSANYQTAQTNFAAAYASFVTTNLTANVGLPPTGYNGSAITVFSSGVTIAADAAVANDTYMAWMLISYLSLT